MDTIPISWSAAIAGWLAAQRAAGHSEGTLTLRRRYLMRLSSSPGMPSRLDEVTTADLIKFLAKNRGWSAETRYSAQSTIRGFFAWAVRRHHVVESPAEELIAVKRTPPNPRPFPEHELTEILDGCDERRRRMIHLAAGLGLRCIEISRVHRRDVIPTNRGRSLVVHGKGDKVRILPLPDDLADVIVGADGWLFPGRDSGHLSAWWVSHLIADVMPEGWTAHTLRHRFASYTHDRTRNLVLVQELLGHASADTTRRYVLTSDDDKRAAILDAASDLGHIA